MITAPTAGRYPSAGGPRIHCRATPPSRQLPHTRTFFPVTTFTTMTNPLFGWLHGSAGSHVSQSGISSITGKAISVPKVYHPSRRRAPYMNLRWGGPC
jgi:hypothetical protein